MALDFERGDRETPAGHALIYFRAGSDVLATYVSVPPVKFDIASYMPPFLTQAMQGMDMGEAGAVAAPMPPIPEEVESYEYLASLADRRHDDLIFAGNTSRDNPMQLAAETAEAAREYGELYQSSLEAVPLTVASTSSRVDSKRFTGMSQQEQLNELTHLTGRLLDSLKLGAPDAEVIAEMRELANVLPSKYRVPDLIAAASRDGGQGRQLAELYLQRCYKLFNEEYLDLEKIDREIASIQG